VRPIKVRGHGSGKRAGIVGESGQVRVQAAENLDTSASSLTRKVDNLGESESQYRTDTIDNDASHHISMLLPDRGDPPSRRFPEGYKDPGRPGGT
jgi:hypothetical protein